MSDTFKQEREGNWTALRCEAAACELPAQWNVRTGRGENLDVCTIHKNELVDSLVGQADVTRL